MKKWEYKVFFTFDVPYKEREKGIVREDVENYLNDLGDGGWEIVNIDISSYKERGLSMVGVAKREKENREVN